MGRRKKEQIYIKSIRVNVLLFVPALHTISHPLGLNFFLLLLLLAKKKRKEIDPVSPPICYGNILQFLNKSVKALA